MSAVFASTPPVVPIFIGGYSELEIIGAAALIALVLHLFHTLVWPAARTACAVVWGDIIAGIRRARDDLRSLRRE